MEKSFQLIRTNPRLTSNIKLVVDSSYNLYFESFDSSRELSNQQYKHYLLNREAILENEVPKFYAKLPKNLAFTPKSQFDADVMYNKYIQQFDNTYYAGANEVEDQWYKEEFEYLSPLYIKKGSIPKKFIILRVDEPAIYKIVGDDYVMGELTKDNFRSEIIDKWKCVTTFDLSNTTNVGKFFDRNVNNNNRFPEFSFFFDTKKYNYSKWGGLEYESGVYKVSEMFLDDKLFYENPHFNLEEFITKGFEDNGLIYPYIFNMKFLFDDTPATPSEYKKWSMNRYFGFYAEDFELVKKITTADLPELKQGLTIRNNVFLSGTTYVNPYVIEYTDNRWIQVDTDFYEVKLQSNGSYKIIADKNLTGYDISKFNINSSCKIESTEENKNTIVGMDEIDKYLTINGEESDMYADVYLIEIFNQYHILKKDSSGYYIQTDYAIESDSKILRYWKGGRDSELSGMTSVINTNGSPLGYSIYRVKLTDIKDFDFDRINTHYSDFDYEKSEYVDTKEVKLYAKEYRDMSIPVRKKTHDKGEDGEYKVKNIASEYTACDETFEIRTDVITPIFEKNQSICKWGYEGSISHSDYPYKLNNNLSNGGVFNRTTNTGLKITSIEEKTLDYFYRIGELYGKNIDPLVDTFSGALWEQTGTTSPFDGEWIFNTTNAFADSELSTTTTYAKLKIPIIKNELYNIELIISSITLWNPSDFFEVGIDPSSFSGATSTDSGATTITINFVGRALSNELRLLVTNAALYFYSVSIIQVVDKHYLNQSTNIQTKLQQKYDLQSVNVFNLENYINSNFDYFDFFFKNDMYYQNYGRTYKKPYLKYSVFGGGDGDLPATALFKGIEYRLYTVQDMVLNPTFGDEETIRNIITQGGQKYNGYKFAVILNENYDLYNFDYDGVSTYSNPVSLGINSNSVYYGNKSLIKSSNEGIHIFLNDKFKNVVIIINKIIPINSEWGSLNNVDKFGENYGLYYGKTLDGFDLYPITGTTPNIYNPNKLTAAYYMETINNLNIKSTYQNYVSYYYIDEEGNYAQTEMIKFDSDSPGSGFTDLKNWNNKFPIFYIDTNVPDSILMKKRSYNVTPLKGPETNIYDKYLVYSNGRPLNESYIDEPLSRQISKYEVDDTKNTIVHGETVSNTNTINRYIGYYEPIFKDLSIFKPTYYWVSGTTYYSISGNYVFDDSLDQFGIVEEIMYSKVNEYDNYLKLKNSDTERSYYPMVDEIGLSQTQRFIFLSPWDRNFYIKTINQQTLLQDYVAIPIQTIVLPTSVKILSSQMYKSSAPTVELANDINLEGKILSGDDKMVYKVTTMNLSASAKALDMRMYYQPTNGPTIDMGIVGTTPQVFPGQMWNLTTLPLSRPIEITAGGSLTEYTGWKVYFECQDHSGSTVVDLKTYNNFNIYNNIIHFNITNPTYSGASHMTNVSYGFAASLSEMVGSLSNISYTAELQLQQYSGGSYVIGKTNTGLITNSTSLIFTDVLLDRSNLNWPWYTTSTTNVKYRAYHLYNIEGVDKYIETESIVYRTGYTITCEVKPFNLVWESTTPTIAKTAGGCSSNSPAGDKFTINSMIIKNIGGPFTGTITVSSTLYKDGNPINVTNSSSVAPIPLNFSELTLPTPTVTKNGVELGQFYGNNGGGTVPLVTKITENYKARIVASYQVTPSSPSVTIMNGSLDYKESQSTTGCIGSANLIWDSLSTPILTRNQGQCNAGTYSGDYFTLTNMIIRNTGDIFSNGTITYTINIYENNGGTWNQISVYDATANATNVTIGTCNVHPYSSPMTLGQNQNYVTLNTRTYKAVITASNVTGSKESGIVTGFNNPGFNCNVVATATVTASNNSVCAGTVVTYTLTHINGGTPTVQWKVNGGNVGGNTITYSYAPTNNDQVSCVMTSSLSYVSPATVTSNIVPMIVNPLNPVSVTIGASANPVCAGSSVTFTATPTNGGTSPSYQWYKGVSPVGSNSTTYAYVPVNGDVVTCVLTSNISCASGNPDTSNVITMIVNAPPIPTISGPSTPCQNGNIIYTTEAGMSNYIWTWSCADTTQIGGGTTSDNSITLNFGDCDSVSGYIRVSYTNSNGCTSATYTQKDVTVICSPNCSATFSPSTVYVGQTIYLIGAPSGLASYSWSGPNGFTSTLEDPTLTATYDSAGIYTLTTTSSNGCSTTCQTSYISVSSPTVSLSPGGYYEFPSYGGSTSTQTITCSSSNSWVATISGGGGSSFANWSFTPSSNCTVGGDLKLYPVNPLLPSTFYVSAGYNSTGETWYGYMSVEGTLGGYAGFSLSEESSPYV